MGFCTGQPFLLQLYELNVLNHCTVHLCVWRQSIIYDLCLSCSEENYHCFELLLKHIQINEQLVADGINYQFENKNPLINIVKSPNVHKKWVNLLIKACNMVNVKIKLETLQTSIDICSKKRLNKQEQDKFEGLERLIDDYMESEYSEVYM